MTAFVKLDGVSLELWLHRNRSPALKEAFLQLLQAQPRATPPKSSRFWALKGIDLELSPGDRLGVVGRNGAGKSTLLRAMAGIYPPYDAYQKSAGDRTIPVVVLDPAG